MAFDAIFQPLQFKNLTVKNRMFRSNISGRFDNYDGSGNQARINWETQVRQGRRGRHHLVVRAGAPARPHRAQLRDDRPRPPHPVLARGGEGGARARLQVHPAVEPRRAAARHQRHRVPEGPVVDRQEGPAARLPVRGDDHAADQGSGRATSPRAPGARARPGWTASSCTAPTAT